MPETHGVGEAPHLRVGSLFSGYRGLDLAVEEVFGAHTVWFSEINEPLARVFAHHWAKAPNLGDITAVSWGSVEPVDILCGGFPCQDVSTVGKRAGLAPGTRSGLWAHMATAVESLQPSWVVIENVRGLLSAPAHRANQDGADSAQRNPETATLFDATTGNVEPDPWDLGNQPARPLRALGAVLGDLADLRYDARWIGLPASAVGAPHQRFRIFILAHRQSPLPNTTRLGLLPRRRDPGPSQGTPRHHRAIAPGHRLRPERTTWLAEQAGRIVDSVVLDRNDVRRWGRYARAIAHWEHVIGRPAPTPALVRDGEGPRPAPQFVEWLMGIPGGWVTDEALGLTANQQLTALGNGVLPLQAVKALRAANATLAAPE